MKRFISKSLSRSGESESESQSQETQTAYEKRRAQVRKAQRKHRDRKATYLKALEHEVVNLRSENQERKDEVMFLREVLRERGVVVPEWRSGKGEGRPQVGGGVNGGGDDVVVRPEEMNGGFDFNAKPVMLTVRKEGGPGKALTVSLPQGSINDGTGMAGGGMNVPRNGFVATASGMGSDMGGITSGMQDMSSDSYLSSPNAYSSFTEGSVQRDSNQDSVDSIIGVDWVLALEHPCMAHFDMISPPYGTHSHMASHQLLQSAPENLQASTAATWQVPSVSIQSLLALSSSFQLQGELTPVQAWYRLKSDPRFGRLVQTQLNMLRKLLANDVKCYGFGAVIDEDIWTLAVEEVLSQAK